MKLLLLIFFISVSVQGFSQNPFHGLFSSSYMEPVKGSSDFRNVSKPIYIIYNRDYCSFFVAGKGAVTFRTRGYETSKQGTYLHTSFSSTETDTTPDGWYGVMIDEGNDDIIFQVNLPNSYSYIVQQAKRYSTDGRVHGSINVKEYNEQVEKMRAKDSLYKSAAAKN